MGEEVEVPRAIASQTETLALGSTSPRDEQIYPKHLMGAGPNHGTLGVTDRGSDKWKTRIFGHCRYTLLVCMPRSLSLLSSTPLSAFYCPHFVELPLAMSESPGTKNQLGGTAQNMRAQPEKVRGPDSSAGGDIHAANARQGDNPAQV